MSDREGLPAAGTGSIPYRQIRASYDDETITVYQAYKRSIAEAAVAEQKLNASPDFKVGRMTWIKPSWGWMLYRAGYSYKDGRQERILALKMRHDDFIGLLRMAVLTHGHGHQSAGREGSGRDEQRAAEGTTEEKTSDVKVQWDPERTVRLEKLPYRSIQIGVPGAVSEKWVSEWIASIEDFTDKARELKRVLDEQPGTTDAQLVELGLVPDEREFVVPADVRRILQMDKEESST
jgi:Domain of unknown function (DUF4291)